MNENDGFGAFVAVALAAGAIFLGFPMLSESTTNSCLALERHVVGSMANLDDGKGAEATVRKAYPGMPPILGRFYVYWKAMTN